MDYFEKLKTLLKLEKEADLSSYNKLTESSSPTDRRQSGLTWYPVAIRNTEIGRGEYLTVEFERTTHQDLNHQFRFGSAVALFSNHDAGNDRVEGTVSFVGGGKMKINLRIDELPDWTKQGKLGIDLLFDNYTYDEMQYALDKASALDKETEGSKAKVPYNAVLKVLTGQSPPTFETGQYLYKFPKLNEKQQEAVHNIMTANELAIVHGPPGTGKTTTLVQAIKALIKRHNKQILVVAPSNTAVDLISEKLADEGLEVLRIGNPARVSDKLLSLTVDGKMAGHEALKTIKKLKKQASEFKNMAHKYKRNFGRAEQEQRKALFNEAHKILKEADQTEQYIIDQLLAKAQVVTATLVGANNHLLKNLIFDTVVIDEAGQALEPGCWIPILKSSKVVILAGDHCQLSPTIKSAEAARKGLSKTLLEKMVEAHPEAVILLEEQYRMHKDIMGYPSKVFYGDALKANHTVSDQVLFDGDEPLLFIDTAGRGFEEKTEGTSVVNSDEADFLWKHITDYISVLSSHYSEADFPTIGIIAPYQEQVKVLRAGLKTSTVSEALWKNITVNTVDSFQGQERDIIYLSLTRSNDDQSIGFLSDIRRMNVAMTRAKKKLVVIGDSATLSKLGFYTEFVSYADEKLGYHSAWEF